MIDRRDFIKVTGGLAATFGVVRVARAGARHPALLCNDCGFGSKKDNCVKCGKWVGSSKIKGYIGDCCGFGSKKENCVKCGKWVGSTRIHGTLCNDCGFGSKKDNCVICGKWLG